MCTEFTPENIIECFVYNIKAILRKILQWGTVVTRFNKLTRSNGARKISGRRVARINHEGLDGSSENALTENWG
ncbi:unnamed protein product [Cylicocyclus nassatus]|uniref:Transposase n=1 Tax=Cylicocyclus nassatus TaxID=53992 RepID=A0AA36HGP0_CYLNA|nr:unnamed protein product [Cylicocyclus nassatus]